MADPRRAAINLAGLLTTLSGLTRLLRLRRRRRSDFRVFILEYHEITSTDESEGRVAAARFRRHVRYLKQHYRLESLRGATRLLSGRQKLLEDCAVLTFDDGYQGNFRSAWPILQEERVPATIFLTTSFLDGKELWFHFARRALEAAAQSPSSLPDPLKGILSLAGRHGRIRPRQMVKRLKYLAPEQRDKALDSLRRSQLPLSPPAEPLTWDQVRQMQDSGCEMGCHTVTHPILSTLSATQQEVEILTSRQRITEETGVRARSFAFPNGTLRDFNADTIEILRTGGFLAACTTIRGSNRPECDPLGLLRIGVGADSVSMLAARLSGVFYPKLRAPVTRAAFLRPHE